MTKKKLRSCSRCGVRHGPPIGNRCKRPIQEFEELNEEMGASQTAAPADEVFVEPLSDAGEAEGRSEETTLQNGDQETPGMSGDMHETDLMGQCPNFSEFRRRREEERWAAGSGGPPPPPPPQPQQGSNSRREPGRQPSTRAASQEASKPPSAGSGIYYQVPWEQYPQHLQGYHQYPPMFRVGTQPAPADFRGAGQESGPPPPSANGNSMDYHTDYRMSRLEKSLGDMADTQKVLLQYHAEALARSHPVTVTQEASRPAAKKDESSGSDTESEAEEWKENFGDDLWKNVKGKREKNPFEQASYLKKGEAVDSFERVMVVTFKTVAQLVEAGGDVRGVVRHGLAMAEKAAKGVYKIEAFTKYDDSVRERAGATGPSAFGTVDQEDTLRFFSYDNVDRSKGWKSGPSTGGAGKKKSEKMCLKYNDQGCSSKTCFYSHRCAACEEVGHSRKECKNLKKKEK